MLKTLNKLLELEINFVFPILLIIALWLFVALVTAIVSHIRYISSDYHRQTGNSRGKVNHDRGLSGEYSIYRQLKKFGGRFFFNLYIPKSDGTTTEIDIIMLHETGIYVFESKNYSGWIFGSEWQQNWTQTFPERSEHFLNPIIQNKVHIKWLKTALRLKNLPIHSFIVFGRDCKLKEIVLDSTEHHVVTQKNLIHEMRKTIRRTENFLTAETLDLLSSELAQYCGAGRAVKKAHAKDVRRAKRRANSIFRRLFR